MKAFDSLKGLFNSNKSKTIEIPDQFKSPFLQTSSGKEKKEAPKLSKKQENIMKMPFKARQEAIRIQNKKARDQDKAFLAKRVPSPLTARECPVCQKPMMVGVGQLMLCHKECKPVYKRAMFKAMKRKQALNESK